MDADKLQLSVTTDGQPPRPGCEQAGAPAPIDPKTGQHEAYWVLSEAERAKGFVRPVRYVYRHVGTKPKYPLRDLTPEEKERYKNFNYAAYEEYPPEDGPVLGRYWTEADLKGGCGTETRMGNAIAETYARDPKYYGATFCCHCERHMPVREFQWLDGTVVGS